MAAATRFVLSCDACAVGALAGHAGRLPETATTKTSKRRRRRTGKWETRPDSSCRNFIISEMDVVTFDTNYLLLTFFVIYIGQIIETILVKSKREKLASSQRDLYYKRLIEESQAMEEERIKEEQELVKQVELLQQENDNIRNQLGDLADNDDDDWSADSSEVESVNLSSHSNGAKSDRLQREMQDLQSKNNHLQSIESDLENVCQKIGDSHLEEQLKAKDELLETLERRIEGLENENKQLKNQIETHNCPLPPPMLTNLDTNLLKYAEQHKEDLTLDFLKKAYDVLLEMKASNPDMDFADYINDLKNGSSNYVGELENLRLAKRQAEIKLQLMKKRYEEELSSFKDVRVEHIFKNSGAKEYLDRLKDITKAKEDIIKNLEEELNFKKKEIEDLQEKYADAEKQRNDYLHAWKDVQFKKEQLENEKRANQQRERRLLTQSMNLSPSSSLVENNQVPPPPPVDVPTVEEILRDISGPSHDSIQYSSLGLDASIPPPPQIDVPFEIFRHHLGEQQAARDQQHIGYHHYGQRQ